MPEVVLVERLEDLRPGDCLGESAEFVTEIHWSTGLGDYAIAVQAEVVWWRPSGGGPPFREVRWCGNGRTIVRANLPMRVLRGATPPVHDCDGCRALDAEHRAGGGS